MGHKISGVGLEVDQAKVFVIKTLFPPTTVKMIRSFLGHTSFYKRFIRDFSKISRPLCRMFEKDENFDFDESCRYAFEEIMSILVTTPIWQYRTRINNLKSCVMLVTMQWEQY